MIRASVACAALLLALAACNRDQIESRDPGLTTEQTEAQPEQAQPELDPPLQGGTDDWRAVAGAADADRLERIVEAWDQALMQAREDFDSEVTAAGAALAPGAGLAGRIQPTPGDYGCRVYKLGSPSPGGLGFVTYPDFRCRVDLTPGGDLVVTKLTGSQRTRGLVYPDREDRGVFIGAQAWGSEAGYPAYGQTPERDQIGAVERIGDESWRIVLPFPRQESLLDVLVLEKRGRPGTS